MLTDHLYLDLCDRKVKIKATMQIHLERGLVHFKNHMVTVTLCRVRGTLMAAIKGQYFIVERYHVAYRVYPLIRTALK